MPGHETIASTYARALADPVRLGIVAALADRRYTVQSLARELDVREPEVARHARALETMGLVRLVSAEPRAYELVREPVFTESAWDQLPLPSRRSAAAAMLTQMHALAAAAIDTGGFDRPDMLLTRTSMPVTEQRWRQASALLAETLERLGQLSEAATADETPEPQTRATAVMLLFENAAPEAPGDEPTAPAFGDDEALEHAWNLLEQMGEVTIDRAVRPEARWEQVRALSEQLRLVATAALCLAGQAPEREPTEPSDPAEAGH